MTVGCKAVKSKLAPLRRPSPDQPYTPAGLQRGRETPTQREAERELGS